MTEISLQIGDFEGSIRNLADAVKAAIDQAKGHA